jgi:hypothetical protein
MVGTKKNVGKVVVPTAQKTEKRNRMDQELGRNDKPEFGHFVFDMPKKHSVNICTQRLEI